MKEYMGNKKLTAEEKKRLIQTAAAMSDEETLYMLRGFKSALIWEEMRRRQDKNEEIIVQFMKTAENCASQQMQD